MCLQVETEGGDFELSGPHIESESDTLLPLMGRLKASILMFMYGNISL